MQSIAVGKDKEDSSFPVLPRHPREMVVVPCHELIGPVSAQGPREILIEAETPVFG